MRKMLQKLTLVAILAFISGGLFAQGTVKGVLLDSETNETLVGATILQVGTNNGTTSGIQTVLFPCLLRKEITKSKKFLL
jgi:iron complex outermembrane receptor protein